MVERFKIDFQVRVGDINYGGHMGNDKFLLLFHDARIAYFDSFGHSEMDIGDGIGVIMSEAQVSYKAEVFLGDHLTVEVHSGEFDRSRFRIEYLVTRKRDGKTVATGYTSMVAFDYAKRRIARIPEGFKRASQGAV